MRVNEVLKGVLQTKSSRHRKIDSKCDIHKFRRFSGKCKTYRLDVYYCTNCGYQLPIADIFGVETLCSGCDKPTRVKIGKMPLMPICSKCQDLKKKQRLGEKVEVKVDTPRPDIDSQWIESEVKSEDVFTEMLDELGLK